MAGKQRISYYPLEKMDAEMRREMERCQREGTPRPESSAVRAHVPAAFWAFANSWRDLFHRGVCDHGVDGPGLRDARRPAPVQIFGSILGAAKVNAVLNRALQA